MCAGAWLCVSEREREGERFSLRKKLGKVGRVLLANKGGNFRGSFLTHKSIWCLDPESKRDTRTMRKRKQTFKRKSKKVYAGRQN